MDRFETLIQMLRRRVPGLELREQEPMSRHTSFRIGGPVRLMALPRSEEEAAQAVRAAAELELPQTLAAPLAAGQQVGTVTVRSGETVLGSWPVTAAGEVQPMTVRLGFERLLAALTAH